MKKIAISLLLVFLGLAMSAAAYRVGQPDGPIFYWGILPGAPLLLLAALSLIPRFSFRALLGATVATLIAVGMPYGLIWYSSVNYSGGGANIGLGLLLIAQPIYVPVAMMMGAVIGHLLLSANASPDVKTRLIHHGRR